MFGVGGFCGACRLDTAVEADGASNEEAPIDGVATDELGAIGAAASGIAIDAGVVEGYAAASICVGWATIVGAAIGAG